MGQEGEPPSTYSELACSMPCGLMCWWVICEPLHVGYSPSLEGADFNVLSMSGVRYLGSVLGMLVFVWGGLVECRSAARVGR